MPRTDDPHVWELVCILRNARNAARRRGGAAAETGHPWAKVYGEIESGLSALLFHLSKYAYR